ncbi:MAG: hypothetical protein RLZZ546_1388 [Bacteroidota bacterium]
MGKYIQCIINTTDEVAIALLSEFDFESFEEKDDHTLAYISSASFEIEKTGINELLDKMNLTYQWTPLEDQNWNEVWESNFEPVCIENICRIRAEFHSEDITFRHEIVIQPKMAFGTGHHQTTYSMIKKMNEIDFMSKSVFDYGCGTGVLAIFASMLGAASIDAVDIEEESYLNTIENAIRNNIKNIHAFQGTIDVVKDRLYDIILANINRNVLLDSVHDIYKLLHNKGVLLISGILSQDLPIIRESYENEGMIYYDHIEKENWLCVKFLKK